MIAYCQHKGSAAAIRSYKKFLEAREKAGNPSSFTATIDHKRGTVTRSISRDPKALRRELAAKKKAASPWMDFADKKAAQNRQRREAMRRRYGR